MFKKANNNNTTASNNPPKKTREAIPTIVTSDVHLLGNLVSEGAVDFSGTIDGNVRCETFTLREQGTVKGEVTANTVHIQGTVKGLIRAKSVHLQASCKVEGIIIHEQLSIEDGAFVDGKFKRSDRVIDTPLLEDNSTSTDSDESESAATTMMSRSSGSNGASNVKVLENIRLIR